MVHLSPPFNPPILKGIKIHPDNPFRFDFILVKGDGNLTDDQLKKTSSELIKYFLASLTIPEKDLWVNLSPYEKNRIIPNSFGMTVMGRDLLAQDYMLKQITASLIYPKDQIGKEFWKRIYEEAEKKFGTTNIPVNTFNKVWIVPEKAVVYENEKAGTAYVVKAELKVMLEEDYLSLEKHLPPPNLPKGGGINALGSQIIREIIIPELVKEVNQNKNFSQLRQVYNSLILATWYKKKIKDSILEQVYADKKKVAGVGYENHNDIEAIYQRYLQAFKKGVYNYIKEEPDPTTQQIVPRKYFSGGVVLGMTNFRGNVLEYVNTISDRSMIVADRNMVIVTDLKEASLGTRFIQKRFIQSPEEAARANRLLNRVFEIGTGGQDRSLNQMEKTLVELRNLKWEHPFLKVDNSSILWKLFKLLQHIMVVSPLKKKRLVEYYSAMKIESTEEILRIGQSACLIDYLAQLIDMGLFTSEVLKKALNQEDIDFYTRIPTVSVQALAALRDKGVFLNERQKDMDFYARIPTVSVQMLEALRGKKIIDKNNKLIDSAMAGDDGKPFGFYLLRTKLRRGGDFRGQSIEEVAQEYGLDQKIVEGLYRDFELPIENPHIEEPNEPKRSTEPGIIDIRINYERLSQKPQRDFEGLRSWFYSMRNKRIYNLTFEELGRMFGASKSSARSLKPSNVIFLEKPLIVSWENLIQLPSGSVVFVNAEELSEVKDEGILKEKGIEIRLKSNGDLAPVTDRAMTGGNFSRMQEELEEFGFFFTGGKVSWDSGKNQHRDWIPQMQWSPQKGELGIKQMNELSSIGIEAMVPYVEASHPLFLSIADIEGIRQPVVIKQYRDSMGQPAYYAMAFVPGESKQFYKVTTQEDGGRILPELIAKRKAITRYFIGKGMHPPEEFIYTPDGGVVPIDAGELHFNDGRQVPNEEPAKEYIFSQLGGPKFYGLVTLNPVGDEAMMGKPIRRQMLGLAAGLLAGMAVPQVVMVPNLDPFSMADRIREILHVTGFVDPNRQEKVAKGIVNTLPELHLFKDRMGRGEDILSVMRDLYTYIKGNYELNPNNGNEDLESVVSDKRADCVGSTQLFYVIAKAIGINVQPIEVMPLQKDRHVASLVLLPDGRVMPFDLVRGIGMNLKPFKFNEVFTSEGVYQMRKSATIDIYERIRLMSFKGLKLYARGPEATLGELQNMLKDDPYNIYGYLWEVNKIAHLLIGEEFIEVTSEVLYDYRKLSGQQRAQVEAIFNRILQFNPSFYDAHTCLGSFYFADKKYDQSAQHYLSAVGLIKKNIPAKKEQTVYLASLYYGLFLAYQEKGDLSQQEMYKTMIKEISPDDYYNYFLKDKDDAMSSQNGGIDFTANKTPLDIQNSNKGIKFYVDPAILQQLQNVSGFVPVIINIRPVNNITEFLGLND